MMGSLLVTTHSLSNSTSIISLQVWEALVQRVVYWEKISSALNTITYIRRACTCILELVAPLIVANKKRNAGMYIVKYDTYVQLHINRHTDTHIHVYMCMYDMCNHKSWASDGEDPPIKLKTNSSTLLTLLGLLGGVNRTTRVVIATRYITCNLHACLHCTYTCTCVCTKLHVQVMN